MVDFVALVGTEVVNIIQPNSTDIILGHRWIDLAAQTWPNIYLKNCQILGWTPYLWSRRSCQAAAVSAMRKNKFLHRPTKKNDKKVAGLFHEFPEILRKAIVLTGMRHTSQKGLQSALTIILSNVYIRMTHTRRATCRHRLFFRTMCPYLYAE